MRIVNTVCINKEKLYVTVFVLIVKVFEENSEITQGGWGAFVCQLRASKSSVCLDQNWRLVDSGKEGAKGPKVRFFRRCHK